MTDRLKPCPFCGSEAEVIMVSDAGNCGVRCKKCSAVVGEYRFWKRPYAIKVWNTRKPMDRIVKQLKEKADYEPIDYDDGGYGCTADDHFIALDTAIEIVKNGGKE